MLKGIDISEHQTRQDFSILKQNFDFVIARSSFGTARADNQFQFNRDGLRGTGQLRGFYHYAYPNNNTPEAEAEFCFKTIGQLQQGELVALDFEENYSDPVSWSLKFLQHFEQLSGYKPLIYINLALIQAHDWAPVVNNNNGLWLAEWDFNPDGTVPSVPWSVVAMRQYTDKLTFNGQTIDADVFYGDANTFTLYGFQGNSASPTPAVDYEKLYNAKREECDLNYNCLVDVCTALNVQVNPTDKQGSVVQAKAAIQSLNDQITQLKKQTLDLSNTNSGLQTQIQQVNQSNASIADLYKKKCEEDSTAIDDARKSEHALQELTSDMRSAADALGASSPDIKDILSAIDLLKTQLTLCQKNYEESLKKAQNFFQLLINIFWRKKK